MSKKDINKKILNKVLDLSLSYSIRESHLYLKFLDNQIKFYQSHLIFLEENKPFFFQKRKLEEHNKEIGKCKRKIEEIYIKMEQEIEKINLIFGLQN